MWSLKTKPWQRTFRENICGLPAIVLNMCLSIWLFLKNNTENFTFAYLDIDARFVRKPTSSMSSLFLCFFLFVLLVWKLDSRLNLLFLTLLTLFPTVRFLLSPNNLLGSSKMELLAKLGRSSTKSCGWWLLKSVNGLKLDSIERLSGLPGLENNTLSSLFRIHGEKRSFLSHRGLTKGDLGPFRKSLICAWFLTT